MKKQKVKVIKDTIGEIIYCGGFPNTCICGNPDSDKCKYKVKK